MVPVKFNQNIYTLAVIIKTKALMFVLLVKSSCNVFILCVNYKQRSESSVRENNKGIAYSPT